MIFPWKAGGLEKGHFQQKCFLGETIGIGKEWYPSLGFPYNDGNLVETFRHGLDFDETITRNQYQLLIGWPIERGNIRDRSILICSCQIYAGLCIYAPIHVRRLDTRGS